VHSDPRRAIQLSLVILLISACVAPEDRKADSANLRDPLAVAAEPSDPIRAAGKQVFVSCASCHLADASGRSDGTIPRLAGQPAGILEERLRGLQAGSIDLPVMTPFARALTDTEIRQVSAYLSSLPKPKQVGYGSNKPGADAAALYARLCVSCHAGNALGQPVLNAPRLCGQHEAYLLRRLDEMAMTTSGNARAADPAMAAITASLSSEDRRAVANHLARLECD
jgi:cytochrome c553